MGYLQKEKTLHPRGADGQVLPHDIKLVGIPGDEMIKAIPMTRGKIQELQLGLGRDGQTTKDQDAEIIKTYCLDPAYTDEELVVLKPNIANAIAIAIMSLSTGIGQEELTKETVKKSIELLEAEQKKN